MHCFKLQDEVMRKATIAQISSYGQTPRQLFRRPHPERIWRDPEPTVFSHPDKYVLVSVSFHFVCQISLLTCGW